MIPAGSREPPREPRRTAVQYPGGLWARYVWVGSGRGDALGDTDALEDTDERGGSHEGSVSVSDHGPLVSPDPDRLCRAELRIQGPLGAWSARFASPIFDEPQGLLWDTAGLLVVKYGFRAYALVGRTGELRWTYEARTPLVSVLGSSRLAHVLVQSEVETAAVREDGEVAWRVAHPDVIAEAELVGGRLVLTGYGGVLPPLDPQTGRSLGRA